MRHRRNLVIWYGNNPFIINTLKVWSSQKWKGKQNKMLKEKGDIHFYTEHETIYNLLKVPK